MKNKTIHLFLMGGLGNQLFQLTAGLYIDQVIGRRVKYSDLWLRAPKDARDSKTNARRLMIGSLVDTREWSDISRFNKKISEIVSQPFRNYRIIETDSSDNAIERITSRTRYLEGYFQDLGFVQTVEGPLIKRLRSSPDFSTLLPVKLEQRIAVHMRFGDYHNNSIAKTFHGLTDKSYYVQAIHLLLKLIDCNQVLIVSDNPTLAKESLAGSFDDLKLELIFSEGQNELEDLALLSHSAGIVMSNSSFSWWAAWIASRSFDAQIIMPSPWFAKPSAADHKLFDVNWRQIPRSLQISD